MKRRKISRRTSPVECLEVRTVPAAMTASVVGGVLTITGSSLSDSVRVATATPSPGQSADYTRLLISAGSGSTINGQVSVVVEGVTAGLKISMQGGDDTVILEEGRGPFARIMTILPQTTITASAGNDNVIVDNAQIQSLSWNGGAGDDRFTVIGTYQRGLEVRLGELNLAGGDGSDSISFSDANLQKLTITTGNDSDSIQLARTVSGPANINTGAGDDLLQFQSEGTVSTYETLDVVMGSGNDVVRFPPTRFAAGSTTVDLGLGDDLCEAGNPNSISPPETSFQGSLQIYGRDGNDTVSMQVRVTDQLFASLGAGNDVLRLHGTWGAAVLQGNTGVLDDLLLRPYGEQPLASVSGFEIRR